MSAAEAGPTRANLLLSGLQPLLLVHVPEASHPLRMILDTGANSTMFSHNAVTDAPVLLTHADGHVLRVGGAGGTETDRKALRLPAVTLTIDGRPFKLEDVAVISHAKAGSDGTIGQDLLRQGARVTLDFDAMRLTIAKAAPGGTRPGTP